MDYNGNFPKLSEGERYGKGFMKKLRAAKREEAESRNRDADVSDYMCGHKHGREASSRCEGAGQ